MFPIPLTVGTLLLGIRLALMEKSSLRWRVVRCGSKASAESAADISAATAVLIAAGCNRGGRRFLNSGRRDEGGLLAGLDETDPPIVEPGDQSMRFNVDETVQEAREFC